MANSSVAMTDVWSINANQAGLTTIKRPTFALSYEKKYLGQSIAEQTAILAMPVKHHVFGLVINRYGFDTYRKQQLGLSYARTFGPALSAALGFRYHSINITNYGHAETYAIDAGLQYQLNKTVLIGAHINNLSKSAFSEQEVYADIPFAIQFGASYRSSDRVLLALALEQNLAANTDAKLGLEYLLISVLALRGGLSLNPLKEYVGLGVCRKGFNLDVSMAMHQVLGQTANLSLSYAF
ncbi:MAG: hypothetical protein ACKOW2_00140 [Sphingobacteriaceae bacterium]